MTIEEIEREYNTAKVWLTKDLTMYEVDMAWWARMYGEKLLAVAKVAKTISNSGFDCYCKHCNPELAKLLEELEKDK